MTNSSKNTEDSNKNENTHTRNGIQEAQPGNSHINKEVDIKIDNTDLSTPLPLEGINEVEKLSKSIKEWEDKYIRLYSEFENYKKRTIKERLELFKTSNMDVLTVLLPVVDDMERIILSAEKTNEKSALKEGLDLVFSKFKNILKQQGLQEMEVKGKEFNTDFHEAITQVPSKDKDEKGKVVEVVEKGYFLYEKVLRYAKVVIGS